MSRGRGTSRSQQDTSEDPFPPGPEGEDDGSLAYAQQLAYLRGEREDGGEAKRVVERVPQMAEKSYAIKSKAKIKSKLEDEANAQAQAQQASGKKKRKGGGAGGAGVGGGEGDFSAEDYEDVTVPGPRKGASPEELVLREAVVNALLAHLGTRQVSE